MYELIYFRWILNEHNYFRIDKYKNKRLHIATKVVVNPFLWKINFHTIEELIKKLR